MCIPAFAAIGTALGASSATGAAAVGTLTVASLALSAGASIASGVARKKAADQQAQLQQIAAKDELAIGRQEEDQFRISLAKLKSTVRSRQSASGVLLDEGSGLDVLTSIAGAGELDALTIRSNAERRAWALRAGASQARSQGRADRTASFLQAGGTLLGGATKVASLSY